MKSFIKAIFIAKCRREICLDYGFNVINGVAEKVT